MVKNETILMNYIHKLSIDDDIKLEDYIKDIFENVSNTRLKEYCKNNCIHYKSNSSKEMLLQSIYRSCNTILSYKMLAIKSIEGETKKEFYNRLYINFINEYEG